MAFCVIIKSYVRDRQGISCVLVCFGIHIFLSMHAFESSLRNIKFMHAGVEVNRVSHVRGPGGEPAYVPC